MGGKLWQQVLEAIGHILFTVWKQIEMHADAQLTSSILFGLAIQHLE